MFVTVFVPVASKFGNTLQFSVLSKFDRFHFHIFDYKHNKNLVKK